MGPVGGGRVWRLGAGRDGAVFGERMRAGAVLVVAGEVWRDVGIDRFLRRLRGVAGQWEAWWRKGGCGLGEGEAAFVPVVEGA